MESVTSHSSMAAGPAHRLTTQIAVNAPAWGPHLLTAAAANGLCPPPEVLVIGGGRWGKILSNTLLRLQPRIQRIHLVSHHNYTDVANWASKQTAGEKGACSRVNVLPSLTKALQHTEVTTALVANAPAEHYETTKRLLYHGRHVLVEKPFVLSVQHATELVELARDRGLVLAIGLEYLFASYLHAFHSVAQQHLSSVRQVEICWQDVAEEQRWSFLKRPDYTTNAVTDLFPHILSLLYVLFGRQRVYRMNAVMLHGGEASMMTFGYGSVPLTVSLSRVADTPTRTITLSSHSGRRLSLDFTSEPGTVSLDERVLPNDDTWKMFLRPLDAEIGHFFMGVQRSDRHLPNSAENMVDTVEATEEASRQLTHQKVQLLHQNLLEEPATLSPDVLVALREHLVGQLLRHALIDSPKERESIDRWLAHALLVIARLANSPFTTQQELLDETGLSRGQLITLNAVLRDSDFVQQVLLRCGHGAKYWQNTIIPLVKSGAVEAVSNEAYRFPFRVGLYPGLSCMFECTFCGRNYGARYGREAIATGEACFKQLFQEACNAEPDTFYISGGLEPLTNPHIGEIIRFGADRGFKLSLYTNGMMLTPRLLEKQAGLWNLSSLRISLYGVDAESSHQVTRHLRGFDQVIKNAKTFLRLRNERGSPLQIGFNYVILPGRARQVLELAERIAEINRDAGGERQVDFLTLREDFTATGAQSLSLDERAELVTVFEQLAERQKRDDLSGLYIDFGYALNPLQQGAVSRPLEMVDDGTMRRRAFPQISVVVDSLGDVYAYREAGFIDRPGARRYIIGNLIEQGTMEEVVHRFLKSGHTFEALPGDYLYLDIFDHVVTKLLNQAEADAACGISFVNGPVRARVVASTTDTYSQTIAHYVPPMPDWHN